MSPLAASRESICAIFQPASSRVIGKFEQIHRATDLAPVRGSGTSIFQFLQPLQAPRRGRSRVTEEVLPIMEQGPVVSGTLVGRGIRGNGVKTQ